MSASPTSERALVLVVEDDADVADITAEIFEAEGFRVMIARDGRQGLALLDARPAVVVLDIMMPVLDGFGFLEEYRRRDSPRPPVLAVSAFDAYLPKAREMGAAAVLRKPHSMESLIDGVRTLLAGGQTPAPTAPAPPDETDRLRAIIDLRLDQPSPGAALDAFTERVARIFDAPMAVVSIVTAARQCWHASYGLPPDLAAAGGSPREHSFCTHAVVARAALVVQDAASNPFFKDNVFVRENGPRFYAGVPLVNRFGDVLGTLCIYDFKSRPFSHHDLELLSLLAKRVVAELESREQRLRPGAPVTAFRDLAWNDEELDILGREAFAQVLQVELLRAAEQRTTLTVLALVVPRARVAHAVTALKEAFPRAHLGRLAIARIGIIAPGMAPEAARAQALDAAGPAAQVMATTATAPIDQASVVLQRLESALGEAGLVPIRRPRRRPAS